MDHLEWHQARAALEWQLEMGADAAILDAPVNRYDLADKAPAKPVAKPVTQPVVEVAQADDPVEVARTMAGQANDLQGLRAALDAYEHCELKRGARNLVFADGVAGSRVMIIGEAPGRDEDQQGKPFVGRAGQLLDKMLAAIDLNRTENVYISNILPWRPPQNRDPRPDEIAMMMPFVRRHVELANPDMLILMGNISCQAVLGMRGITRLRGKWAQGLDRPVMPMLHPAYLLRQGHAKRLTWQDLLAVKSWLREN